MSNFLIEEPLAIMAIDIKDIALELGWQNSVFYTIAAIDGLFIVLGLHGNLSILTRRTILTEADDPLIKSTALADLLLDISSIVPVFFTAIYRRWVLGDTICILTAYVQPIPKGMELMLMTVLALQRLYVLKFPLNSYTNVRKRRRLCIWLSIVLWAVFIAVSIALEIRNREDGVEFFAPRMNCEQVWMRNDSDFGSVVRLMSTFLFQIGPLLITIVANILVLLICYRRRDPGNGRKKELQMAIFSEGGTNYIDILLTIFLITTVIISSFLNPLVFLHNSRKPTSIAVFLFRCLAVFDFAACIFIPLKVVLEAMGEKCSVENLVLGQVDNRNRSCVARRKPGTDVHLLVKIYSLLGWNFVLTSNFIAAMMAICRYVQIRHPFFPLKLKPVVVCAAVFISYTLAVGGYGAFDKASYYAVDKQLVGSRFGIEKGVFTVILIYVWPSIVCQFASVITSGLTAQHLFKTQKGPLAQRSSTASRKCSMKILVTNFGSITMNFLMMVAILTAHDQTVTSTVQFIGSNLATVLLSCFNPIIFIWFTPNFGLFRSDISARSVISVFRATLYRR
ncbi:hypothetical protein ACHWQZ_G003178 [Mnemiopsis leidyi]